MFTGLIRCMGTIARLQPQGGGHALVIESDDPLSLPLGASIACHGICLTVTASEATARGTRFDVILSPETWAVTTAAHWREGMRLNLEPSLTLGQPLDGHLVSGHVDAVGHTLARTPQGQATRWEFAAPVSLAPCIAVKGSIAIDGVSLTVNSVADDAAAGHCRFSVMIIPHTAVVTSFGALQPGDRVNLEADLLARYVARGLALAGAVSGRAS